MTNKFKVIIVFYLYYKTYYFISKELKKFVNEMSLDDIERYDEYKAKFNVNNSNE
jgi:hypothetical protein